MPTIVTELRIERQKRPTVTRGDGTAVALFCMAGLVGGLIFLFYLAGTPDLPDVAQLVGP